MQQCSPVNSSWICFDLNTFPEQFVADVDDQQQEDEDGKGEGEQEDHQDQGIHQHDQG